MVNELKNYQSQCNAYKFEIERLNKEIGKAKSQYFEAKKNGTLEMIPEEPMDEQQAMFEQ